MSEKLIGIIEDKQSKEGETNGKFWKRFMFKIAGKTLSSFDTELDKFKLGEAVEVEYTTQGNYHNIASMKYAEEKVTVVKPGEPIPTADKVNKNFYDTKKEEEASKVASVLISYVKDMVCEGKIEPGNLKENVRVLVETYQETKKNLLK